MLCSKIEIYFNITINKNKVIKINHRIIVKFGDVKVLSLLGTLD